MKFVPPWTDGTKVFPKMLWGELTAKARILPTRLVE